MLPCIFISSVFGQKKNLETVVNNPTAYEEITERELENLFQEKYEKDLRNAKGLSEIEDSDNKHETNIIINYNNKKTKKDKTSYVLYGSALKTISGYEYFIDSDFLEIEDGKIEVENIFQDIIDHKINSYSKFIRLGNDLNEEDQKLMLLNIWAERLNHNYSMDNRYLPQDTIFWYMQDSLINNNYHPNGDCTPISFSTERVGEDLGKNIDVISATLHNYNIVDTKKGLAIIDSYHLLRLDNYDIEEILRIYQKISGKTTFRHEFFDKGKLKQILITENGKRFLEAVKYENPKNSLEKTLLSNDKNKSLIMESEINKTDYLTSISNNLIGIFLRIGKIDGKENSATKEMFFYQTGFDRDFLFKDKLKLDINSSYIGGQIKELRKIEDSSKEEYEITNFPVRGFMANLGLAYYDLYGINIGTNYSLFCLEGDQNYKVPVLKLENGEPVRKYITKDYYLSYINELGIGASYNLQIKNFNLKPYLIMNKGFYSDNIKDENLSKNFKDYLGKGLFSELGKLSAITMEYGGGISSEFEISPFKIGINPFCFIRQNEKELGAKGNLEFSLDGKTFGLEGNFSDIKSNYIFNPNKRILGTGVYVQIGNLGIKVGHESETRSDIKNRWLEHEHNYNFNINYNF